MTNPLRSSRSATVFILVTLFIDTVGFGLIIPVMPDLIMDVTGEGLGEAALYGGWLLFIFALAQFFASPVLGNLSDRFGRRPVLLLSLFAFGCDYVLMGLAPTITWLFIGRAIAGVCGATATTAFAYASDVTPAEERARNFGLIGAAWGVGFTVGPAVGGLLGELGPRVPFFVAAGMALLNMAYGYFVLPESLPPEKRRRFELRRANPLGALIEMRKYPVVFGLLGVIFLYQIAHDANPSVWTYYTIERFGWSMSQVGLSVAFVGVCLATVQAGLVGRCIGFFGEKGTVYFGLSVYALGFALFAVVWQGWMMFLVIPVFAMGSVAMPAIRSIMSNIVPANAQGELHGAINSLASLTAIFAPLFMTRVFHYFIAPETEVYFPGAPFVAAAVLVVMSGLSFSVVYNAVVSRVEEPAAS